MATSRFQWLGDRAIRFARPPGPTARALVRAARAWPGVVDVVVAREDVAIYFARPLADVDARIVAVIARLGTLPPDDEPAREHVIRVVYDGPDLADIARVTGLSIDDVVATHSACTYTVALLGFAPGFAYLDGLDHRLVVPRRTTPRPRVSAGTLAIAGDQTAVYPFAGPGGWNLIGHVVDAVMFDARGPLLALGDRVRFVA